MFFRLLRWSNRRSIFRFWRWPMILLFLQGLFFVSLLIYAVFVIFLCAGSNLFKVFFVLLLLLFACCLLRAFIISKRPFCTFFQVFEFEQLFAYLSQHLTVFTTFLGIFGRMDQKLLLLLWIGPKGIFFLGLSLLFIFF
jgi:hypothetical protein